MNSDCPVNVLKGAIFLVNRHKENTEVKYK